METTYIPIARWMDKENVLHAHIHTHGCVHNGIQFSLKKQGNSAIWDSLDEYRWQYAKCNKLDTERQILYDLTDMGNLKKSNPW